MYIHMLGYPTHFGQMETLKLIAANGFAEKVESSCSCINRKQWLCTCHCLCCCNMKVGLSCSRLSA